jgi:hypothetical protein
MEHQDVAVFAAGPLSKDLGQEPAVIEDPSGDPGH